MGNSTRAPPPGSAQCEPTPLRDVSPSTAPRGQGGAPQDVAGGSFEEAMTPTLRSVADASESQGEAIILVSRRGNVSTFRRPDESTGIWFDLSLTAPTAPADILRPCKSSSRQQSPEPVPTRSTRIRRPNPARLVGAQRRRRRSAAPGPSASRRGDVSAGRALRWSRSSPWRAVPRNRKGPAGRSK